MTEPTRSSSFRRPMLPLTLQNVTLANLHQDDFQLV
jgi:hypothetical protein